MRQFVSRRRLSKSLNVTERRTDDDDAAAAADDDDDDDDDVCLTSVWLRLRSRVPTTDHVSDLDPDPGRGLCLVIVSASGGASRGCVENRCVAARCHDNTDAITRQRLLGRRTLAQISCLSQHCHSYWFAFNINSFSNILSVSLL